VHFDWNKMKEILHYSYPFLFTALVSVLMSNLDKIMLRVYFSLAAVGIYSLAMKFSTLLQELYLEPFNRSFGAYRFSVMDDPNAREILAKVYTYMMVGVFFMTLGIGIYSKEIIRIMTDQAYWPAYVLIPFLTLSTALGASSYVFQTGMLFMKKTKYMIHISTASACLNVGLYFLLIPKFGLHGAVATMIIKGTVDTILMYIVGQKLYHIPYDLTTVLKMLVITVGFILFAGWLPPMHLVISLVVKTLIVLAFPVALYMAGCVKRADVMRLWEFLQEQKTKIKGMLPAS
jgi:O-antigen/teichoic acid export membrane protein